MASDDRESFGVNSSGSKPFSMRMLFLDEYPILIWKFKDSKEQ